MFLRRLPSNRRGINSMPEYLFIGAEKWLGLEVR
jgi:hypothetical protein